MIAFSDSVYRSTKIQKTDTGKYVAIVSELMRNRFFLSPLNYRFSENWVAYTCGKLFWSHFSSKVIADEIIKHPNGLCSQQTIVFMEILRRKNINVRSVGLGFKEGPGHFLCEVQYDGSWHLHDVSIEPVWSKLVSDHQSMQYYLTKKDSLYIAYESRLPKSTFNKILEKVEYGEVNKMPAKKMWLFQKLTGGLTYFIPLILLFAFVYSLLRLKKKEPGSEKVTSPLVQSEPAVIDFVSQ